MLTAPSNSQTEALNTLPFADLSLSGYELSDHLTETSWGCRYVSRHFLDVRSLSMNLNTVDLKTVYNIGLKTNLMIMCTLEAKVSQSLVHE